MHFKGEIPFVRLLIPFILGIALAWFLPYYNGMPFIGLSVLLLLGVFMVLLYYYHKSFIYRRPWLSGLVVHTVLFLAGYLICLQRSQHDHAGYFTTSADALILEIISEPTRMASTLRFQANVLQRFKNQQAFKAEGKLAVTLLIDSLHPVYLSYGSLLLIPPWYNAINPPHNPGEFNFKSHWAKKEVYYQTFLKQAQIQLLPAKPCLSIVALALQLRQVLVQKLHTYLPNPEAASLMSTLLLGYRADLSREVMQTYSQTGTMHVLAVSGMHVGLIFFLLGFILSPLERNQSMRIVTALLTIALIGTYALLTGLSPSVCRAVTMFSFVVLGRAFRRSTSSYNLVAISAFILLVYKPMNLFEVGFQLSYVAVLGLIYFQPRIYRLLRLKNKAFKLIWKYASFALAAQLATFPLSIFYFHQFPLYFLLSNLFIALPVVLLMYVGIMFLAIPFPALLKPFGLLLGQAVYYLNTTLAAIQHMPYASLGGLWISPVQCLLLYLLLLCFAWLLFEGNKKVLFVFLSLLLLFSISITRSLLQNQDRHELICFAVKKNVHIAHISKGEGTLISKMAPTDKTVDYLIKPALSSKGAQLVNQFTFQDEAASRAYQLSRNFMQFGNYSMFRWDPTVKNLSGANKIRVNALLLGDNPRVKLSELQQKVDFSMLLIEGTNADYRIKQWEAEARLLQIPYHILKETAALILKL